MYNRLSDFQSIGLDVDRLECLKIASEEIPELQEGHIISKHQRYLVDVILPDNKVIQICVLDELQLCTALTDICYNKRRELTSKKLPHTNKCSKSTKWFSRKLFNEQDNTTLKLGPMAFSALFSPTEALALFAWVYWKVCFEDLDVFWSEDNLFRKSFMYLLSGSPEWSGYKVVFRKDNPRGVYLAMREIGSSSAPPLKSIQECIAVAASLGNIEQTWPARRAIVGNQRQILDVLSLYAFRLMRTKTKQGTSGLDVTIDDKIKEGAVCSYKSFIRSMSETDILAIIIWLIEPEEENLPETLTEFWITLCFNKYRTKVFCDITGTTANKWQTFMDGFDYCAIVPE